MTLVFHFSSLYLLVFITMPEKPYRLHNLLILASILTGLTVRSSLSTPFLTSPEASSPAPSVSLNNLPEYPTIPNWRAMCDIGSSHRTVPVAPTFQHAVGSLTWATCRAAHSSSVWRIPVPSQTRVVERVADFYFGGIRNPRVDRGRFEHLILSCHEPHQVRLGKVFVHVNDNGRRHTLDLGALGSTHNPLTWFWQDFPEDMFESHRFPSYWEIELYGGPRRSSCSLSYTTYILTSQEMRLLESGGNTTREA